MDKTTRYSYLTETEVSLIEEALRAGDGYAVLIRSWKGTEAVPIKVTNVVRSATLRSKLITLVGEVQKVARAG